MSETDSELKVDPVIMAFIGVVLALLIVAGAYVFMSLGPTSAGDDPATATVRIDETSNSVIIIAEGVFPDDELYIHQNGERIETLDVGDGPVKIEWQLTAVQTGDVIDVRSYVNGEIQTVQEHTVSERLGNQLN